MPMHYNLSQHNPRVNVDHFSMVPRADIPRSTFTTQHTHKTTLDGGYLNPIYVDEVLPGDTFHGELTMFARMQTLLFPLMDNITAETFFFFVPNRILWDHWVNMMGEQRNPADTISYTLPQVVSPNNGWPINSLQDYMGIPVAGQIGGGNISVNALPMRAYNLIWNEWFRDQNLQNSKTQNTGDGPDPNTDYVLLRRNKRHDYFTSALPWPLKNNTAVTLPISGTAPVYGIGVDTAAAGPTAKTVYEYGGLSSGWTGWATSLGSTIMIRGASVAGGPNVVADLSQATGATIAALRLAVQTQRFLERDARSGTRYTELLRAHFGVLPEDARLQRPEYIGGGRSAVQTQAIPQTSATGATGTPLAALGGASTITGQHRFTYNATEHGFIIGLLHIDAELTYQQGLRRLWTRLTRLDHYWPVFAHLSEQPIRNDEIFCIGSSIPGQDAATFGYQERWAEYRHFPSQITGLFRSTSLGTIDTWHSAQKFAGLPTLNDTFVQSTPPFSRNLAAGTAANGQQFLADMLFTIKRTRPMPMYSVPGGMDRF